MKLFLYPGEGVNPHRNLAVEQALLERVPRDSCILYLWQNRHTVVIGRNQNPWRECRVSRLEADGGTLARRMSGGGAVFHDLGNLNFTFLLHEADYSVEKQLSVIVHACRALGIPAERSGRNDVLADGRKFSGNAFYRHQGRCFHHGTLLVDADMQAMERYLSPSKAKLQAKGVASVRSRVVNLARLADGLTVARLARALEEAFGRCYGGTPERLGPGWLDGRRVDELEARYADWQWRFGSSLPCSVSSAGRFAWGEVTLELQEEEGTVRRAAVYSDAMDWTLAPALEAALTGRPLSRPALARGVEALEADPAVKADLLTLLDGLDI